MPIPAASKNLFQNYQNLNGVYDEMMTQSRQIRPHWEPLVQSINQQNDEELAQRLKNLEELSRELGLTGRELADSQPSAVAHQLDALPVVIPASEWQGIQAAIQQRAEVLNLVLKDLYGKQELLARGILPSELVLTHPSFLRPCLGIEPPDGRFLNFYAADVARSSTGNWYVLADRTDAPSGLGRIVQNRIALSRTWPAEFRQNCVVRLAGFFITARNMLAGLASKNRENPRIVVLGPGPTDPQYLEEAYLARYLGYSLVQKSDLTIRNGRVLLQTLEGPLPVDVILRRRSSRDAHQPHLHTDSCPSTAGLMQAFRSGIVGIANGLGSGLIESTVFMAFIPRLCRTLLGEELLMPGVATWWCGQPESLEYVLKHIDDLRISPAIRRSGPGSLEDKALEDMPRAALVDAIKANPGAFAAQESVVRSTVPIWSAGPQIAHVTYRMFATADQHSYTVLPGSWSRVDAKESRHPSNGQSILSKDTWISTEGPVETPTLLRPPTPPVTEILRSGVELSSRIADDVYWFGRYLERAEALARLLRSTTSRLADRKDVSGNVEFPVLVQLLAELGQLDRHYLTDKLAGQLPRLASDLSSAMFDGKRPESMRSVLDQVVRLASLLQGQIAPEIVRFILRTADDFQMLRFNSTSEFKLRIQLENLVQALIAVVSMTSDNMLRTYSWYFYDLGRHLERALQLIRLIRKAFLPTPKQAKSVWETILELSDSLEIYRSRYFIELKLIGVVDLLLTDETNPRSVAYQFFRLNEDVKKLPRDDEPARQVAEHERLCLVLTNSMRNLDIEQLVSDLEADHCEPLSQLIAEWESDLYRLSEAITNRYLLCVDSY